MQGEVTIGVLKNARRNVTTVSVVARNILTGGALESVADAGVGEMGASMGLGARPPVGVQWAPTWVFGGQSPLKLRLTAFIVLVKPF